MRSAFLDEGKTQSCLDKAPAQHTRESVQVKVHCSVQAGKKTQHGT